MADIKNVISKRLYSLFEINNIKQKDLAKYLNVTDNTVSYFYNGRRMPNIEQIIKIADYFNVSTDYLLGVSDVPTTDTDLKAVCEYVNLSQEAVERLHNLPASQASTLDEIIKNPLFIYFLSDFNQYKKYANDYYYYMNLEYCSDVPIAASYSGEYQVEEISVAMDKSHKDMRYSLYEVQEYIKDIAKDIVEKEAKNQGYCTDIVEACKISAANHAKLHMPKKKEAINNG